MDLPQKPRKTPIKTTFRFTKAALQQVAEQMKALSLKQVECCDTDSRGLRAMIYPSGLIVFYSRYNYRHRPDRIKLGEFDIMTVEQARAMHRANRLVVAQGGNPKQNKLKVLTYAEYFETIYLPQNQDRKKSIRTDLSRYNTWLKKEFGNVALPDISPTQCARFVRKVVDAGLAPATVNHIIGMLKSSLDSAVDMDLLEKNPARAIKLLPKNNRRLEFLGVEDMRKFMLAARGDEALVASRMLMLLALTGARLGEAMNMLWQHVDFENRIWRLPTQKSGKPGVIHLSDMAIDVLREMQAVRRNLFVFPSKDGLSHLSRPIRVFHRICTRAGLVGPNDEQIYRPHDLRHAWCSIAIHAEIPIEIVSHGARHSTPAITRTYSHPFQEDLRRANEAVANLIA